MGMDIGVVARMLQFPIDSNGCNTVLHTCHAFKTLRCKSRQWAMHTMCACHHTGSVL